jgi:hypothetical protein
MLVRPGRLMHPLRVLKAVSAAFSSREAAKLRNKKITEEVKPEDQF